MKITIWPETTVGKVATGFTAAFVIIFGLMLLPLGFRLPIGAIGSMGFGVVGSILGVIALVKRDVSAGTLVSAFFGAAILLVAGAIWFSTLGLFKDFKVVDKLDPSDAGAVAAVTNLGQISQKDGWIYFVDRGKLYKVRTDWTEKSQVGEEPVASIFISDDLIYFTDGEDVSNLYSMRLDGSERVKVSGDNISGFILLGDWVFYKTKRSWDETNEMKSAGKATDETMAASELCKVRTDGSGRVKLADVREDTNLVVHEGYAYFSLGESVYRIAEESTKPSLVAETGGAEHADGGLIYYTVRLGDNSKLELWRMKPDGTGKSMITSIEGASYYRFDGSWLYYGLSGKGLYRIGLDGTGQVKLNDVNIWDLLGVSGDWMYIQDYGGPVFRVKLDGSAGTRVR